MGTFLSDLVEHPHPNFFWFSQIRSAPKGFRDVTSLYTRRNFELLPKVVSKFPSLIPFGVDLLSLIDLKSDCYLCSFCNKKVAYPGIARALVRKYGSQPTLVVF